MPRPRGVFQQPVKPHGAKLYKGALVVPVRKNGELCSLQFIGENGEKRFLTDGEVAGCYTSIGKPNGALCICEGFATGASIHEATRHAVAIATNFARSMRGANKDSAPCGLSRR